MNRKTIEDRRAELADYHKWQKFSAERLASGELSEGDRVFNMQKMRYLTVQIRRLESEIRGEN